MPGNATLTPNIAGVTDVLAALEWACENEAPVAYRISRQLSWNRHRMEHFAEFARQFAWVASRDGSDDPARWAGAVAGLASPRRLWRPDYVALGEQAIELVDGDDRRTRRLLRSPVLSLEELRSAETAMVKA
jgi:hypothetical protein